MDTKQKIETLECKIKLKEGLKESREKLLKSDKKFRFFLIVFIILIFISVILFVSRYDRKTDLIPIGFNIFNLSLNAYSLGAANSRISRNKFEIKNIEFDINFLTEELEVLKKLGGN